MLDDDAIEIQFDPPDEGVVWEHYLETCRRAGVERVSRERNGPTRILLQET